DVQTGRRPYE
nr:Chain A, Protein A27 [Vaccinia virus WR]